MPSSADAGDRTFDPAVNRPVTRELAGLKLDELLAGVQRRLTEISRTGDRLQALLDAVLAVSGELELDATLDQIVRAALELLEARSGALTVFDPDRGPAETVAVNLDPESVPEHHVRVPHARGAPESRTSLAVPVRVRGELFGTLYVRDKHSGAEFSADDEIVLRSLAAAAGVAVENARLFEQSRVREQWLEAVAELNADMLAGASLGESLQRIAEVARELSAASATVLLLVEDDEALSVGAVSGQVRQLDVGAILSVGPALARVIRTVEPIVLDVLDVSSTSLPSSFTRAFGPAVISPMRSAAGPQGVLLAVRETGQASFSRQQVTVTSSFAEQATVALEFASKQAGERNITLLADRDRIAQDLHDHVVQRLFATGMSLQGILRQVRDPYARDRIGRAVQRLDQTVREIRTSIFDLHSVGEASGTSLRRRLLDAVSRSHTAPSVRIGGAVDTLVPEALGRDVERVVATTLEELARGAGSGDSAASGAPRIELDIDVAESVTVEVSGQGLPPIPEDAEWVTGLRGLAREHGGDLLVRGGGATTRVVWTAALPEGNDTSP